MVNLFNSADHLQYLHYKLHAIKEFCMGGPKDIASVF